MCVAVIKDVTPGLIHTAMLGLKLPHLGVNATCLQAGSLDRTGGTEREEGLLLSLCLLVLLPSACHEMFFLCNTPLPQKWPTTN